MIHSPEPVDDPWAHLGQITSRLTPSCADTCYLVWVDLNKFLRTQASTHALKILDYGAGASPYRQYFPNADYRRADITGADYLDYRIGEESKIEEADETFDIILSTQVAEHVPNTDLYFSECHRLLKKGGRLILTTHGIWEEHGSPYDFQRWTLEGFRRDLRKAGFEDMEIFKLTCGLRAGIVLFTRILFSSKPPKSAPAALFFRGMRFFYSKVMGVLFRVCESWFPEDAVVHVGKGDPGPPFYVDIAGIAKKGHC